MNRQNALFKVEGRGDTIIVSSKRDLTEFAHEKLENEARDVLSLLDEPEYRNIVVDLSESDYCSSTALGLFLKLWKAIRDREGSMAFCGLSEHENDVFRTMNLDTLWPICTSLEDALKAVEG